MNCSTRIEPQRYAQLAGDWYPVLMGWWWLGQPMPDMRVLELVLALGSLFVLGLSLGLVFEVFGTVYSDLRKVFSIVTRPLFFVSGAFFTMGMLRTNKLPRASTSSSTRMSGIG